MVSKGITGAHPSTPTIVHRTGINFVDRLFCKHKRSQVSTTSIWVRIIYNRFTPYELYYIDLLDRPPRSTSSIAPLWTEVAVTNPVVSPLTVYPTNSPLPPYELSEWKCKTAMLMLTSCEVGWFSVNMSGDPHSLEDLHVQIAYAWHSLSQLLHWRRHSKQ